MDFLVYFCCMARIHTKNDLSRKEIILHAAASLFRKKGYKAASMRDLAGVVGVEASSLYNHIQSKADLLKDICFMVGTRFFAHLEQTEASTDSAIQKTETLIRFHIRQMFEDFETVIVSDREWRHLQEPALSEFREQRRTYRKRFAKIIAEGIEGGTLKDMDTATAVLIMLHAISGIESWHRSNNKISAAELEENMVNIFINGLKK